MSRPRLPIPRLMARPAGPRPGVGRPAGLSGPVGAAQGGVSESPDAAVAPVQPEWRCSSGRQRRGSRRAQGVQLRCSVTGARPSPGRRPAGGSVQRVLRRAWQWQAGGRLRISGGGLSRIPLSLGIAFDQVGRVRPGSCGAARWRSHGWLRASLALSESPPGRAAGGSVRRQCPPGPGSGRSRVSRGPCPAGRPEGRSTWLVVSSAPGPV
jgi:hypothetical protein